MPILEYKCEKCKKVFEELVKRCDEAVCCPVCGEKAIRSWSGKVYSQTGKQPKKCSGNCSSCHGCS